MTPIGIALLFCLVSSCFSEGRTHRPADATDEATLHLFDSVLYPDAKCLDGSSAGFYIRHATSDAAGNKWVFSLQGGGECVTQSECEQRATTSLGSSQNWTHTVALRHIQDVHEHYSPFMYDWNMVFIPYCSGDLHLGQVSTASPRTWGFRFSGHFIIQAVFAHLQQHMQRAEMVVWSGESAGGIGCVAHVDWVASIVPRTVRVVGATIGGFYWFAGEPYDGANRIPFTEWTSVAWKQYYQLYQAFVPERCVRAQTDWAAQQGVAAEPWLCALANVSFATIKTPMFFVQAQTDRAVMKLHDGVPSAAPPLPTAIAAYATAWATNMSQALHQVHLSDTAGLFNAACWIHTSFRFEHPTIGDPPWGWMDTFNNWAFNLSGPTKLWDDCGSGILCNPTCPEVSAHSDRHFDERPCDQDHATNDG